MSFQYSSIGDNTPENREHLEKLGYLVYKNPDKKYIHPYTNQYQQAIAIGWGFEDIPKGAIDCRNNPQLFKAVSAMRDDSDKHQYFVAHCFIEFFPMKDQSDIKTVSGGQLFLCKKDNIKSIKAKWLSFHCVDVLWHKASISDIQAHFQRV